MLDIMFTHKEYGYTTAVVFSNGFLCDDEKSSTMTNSEEVYDLKNMMHYCEKTEEGEKLQENPTILDRFMCMSARHIKSISADISFNTHSSLTHSINK